MFGERGIEFATLAGVDGVWVHAEVLRLVEFFERECCAGRGRVAHRVVSFLRFSGLLDGINCPDLVARVDRLESSLRTCPDFIACEVAGSAFASAIASLSTSIEALRSLEVVERGRAPWQYVLPDGRLEVCPWCQKEFGVPVDVPQSGAAGCCVRHRQRLAGDVAELVRACGG